MKKIDKVQKQQKKPNTRKSEIRPYVQDEATKPNGALPFEYDAEHLESTFTKDKNSGKPLYHHDIADAMLDDTFEGTVHKKPVAKTGDSEIDDIESGSSK